MMEPINLRIRMADDEYVLAAIQAALGDDSPTVARQVYLGLSKAGCIIFRPDTDERGSYGFSLARAAHAAWTNVHRYAPTSSNEVGLMGSWTSDGEYIVGKVEAVQMDKNRVRKRANLSEQAMRRIRAILQDPEVESDSDIVDAVIDTLDEWEDHMKRLDKCGAELSDSVRCGLPVGHKSRHVGYDGENHRHNWTNNTDELAQESV